MFDGNAEFNSSYQINRGLMILQDTVSAGFFEKRHLIFYHRTCFFILYCFPVTDQEDKVRNILVGQLKIIFLFFSLFLCLL